MVTLFAYRSLRRSLFAACLLLMVLSACGSAIEPDGGVTVWHAPGGEITASSDYEVTVRRGGRTWRPFVYHSASGAYDKTLDAAGEYVKLSFLALHSSDYVKPAVNRDTYAHSWTNFDFAGGPVEVEVKVKPGIDGLTFPLRSCAVLPSALGIRCEVVGADTVRFTLTRPAKIAIVPNAREAVEKVVAAEAPQAFEGYRNPLFLFARAPETDAPPKDGRDTLVIEPGRQCTPAEFAKARVIWFAPGVHDYSRYNPNDSDHYMELRRGQTMYLAGGAYVFGQVSSAIRQPIADMPVLCGRGTLSGAKARWTGVPYVTTVERNVRMEGIQITDPHNHISHSIAPVKDVAVVGAWHGNTDGFTREVPATEPFDGWHVEDCFVMAADTNLKLGGRGRARACVLWQLNNAEPLWIRQPQGVIADQIHVIAFHSWSRGQVVNFSAARGEAGGTLVRNLTLEAPFSPFLFFMPSEHEGAGPAYRKVTFQNITINTPRIRAKSIFGPRVPDGGEVGRVVFQNLVINGVKITDANGLEYFDLKPGVTIGREIVFE